MNILLVLLVFLVRTAVRSQRWSAVSAHLSKLNDIQCRLHDALDYRTSGWRKGITELLDPAEDAEDSGGDHFGRLGHRCSGQILVPRGYLMGPPILGVY